MCSMLLAPAAYKFSTCLMSAGASVTVRLISPEQGKAAARSSTSDASVLPVLDMISATKSQGIMPLSQYAKSRK